MCSLHRTLGVLARFEPFRCSLILLPIIHSIITCGEQMNHIQIQLMVFAEPCELLSISSYQSESHAHLPSVASDRSRMSILLPGNGIAGIGGTATLTYKRKLELADISVVGSDGNTFEILSSVKSFSVLACEVLLYQTNRKRLMLYYSLATKQV